MGLIFHVKKKILQKGEIKKLNELGIFFYLSELSCCEAFLCSMTLYLLLTEFEVHTVSYSRLGHKWRGKRGSVTCNTDREKRG